MPELSDPFKLSPGIVVKGARITDCQVRLLTRGERKAIALEQDETTRDDLFFAQSIARLGTIEDRNEISEAVDSLLRGDELRIRGEMAKLDAKFLPTEPPTSPTVKRILRATDIVSKPFALNPGLAIDKQQIKTCVVRLLTRGEWKKLEAEDDGIKKDDLFFLLSIVQFGNIIEIKPEYVDQLVDVDIQRINGEIGELGAQYAPETKSIDGGSEPD